MQSDAQPLPHTGDSSPLPPTSPSLTTTFRHHPQPVPTPTAERPELRHRQSPRHSYSRLETDTDTSASLSTIKISIHTPFGETDGSSQRRKEGWTVTRWKTVEELKDDLANGTLEGAGNWERGGMRLVYHGRIVRDQERLGDVVGKIVDPTHVYIFHLVARRVGYMTPLPRFTNPMESAVPSTQAPPAQSLPTAAASSSSSSSSSSVSINTLALYDTIHYLLFTARHHLLVSLGNEPLKWDDVVPKPTIPMHEAREAIMSVVRTYADERNAREEGWEDWEGAFEGDEEEGLKEVWAKLGGREGVEKELKVLWATGLGRNWTEKEDGEKAEVELDGITYSLQLPRLRDQTPSQLSHLLLYLRITTLLPMLNHVLAQSEAQANVMQTTAAAQLPTPTQALHPRRVIYRRTFRLTIPTIPFSVLSTMFFSALRVTAMIWMLTRGMKWSDTRFWIIAAMAGGWWLAETAGQIARHRREVRARNPTPTVVPPEANAGGGAAAPDSVNLPAQAAQAQVQAQAQAFARRPRQSSNALLTTLIPHFHLDVDSAQLRLPPTDIRSPTALAQPARQRPPRWQTQLLLPVILWFVTLIPEWESIRARAIRRRERAMRVIVGELQQSDQAEGQEATETRTPPVLPEGLSESARKYYTRVMERGEGIDWEEEREAQRAMGVADEDEPEGEGMRLRML
ncbi:hypothetical protein CI109_100580 [Kwoniella shandongensis]|uniref:Uncharacterized protein n=1 Tax=Kwoniella shandongensis TaxID=1734106 RepID=A0A5M6C4U6_9TREE|nr:uncharacterized protein CI109_003498 [Kwoniella shandongensis]KAA5528209.1 hypothetical protein CI109_003498 [Kwoniella shandongensis]